MRTYYIEIERQGWALAVVKVEAENFVQAKLKAFEAIHANDDVYELEVEQVRSSIQSGEIDYVIDEHGDEVDVDSEEEQNVIYRIYSQDESGFENIDDVNDYEEAIAIANNIWKDGDNGFAVVSVHEITNEDEDISEDNQIWYADHNM